jgi:UDP-N-acetyl-2-amino-2-deoxyglucuronate dehydrogenase
MREIGFAIVGCGMIARFHARALAEIPGTRIAALVGHHPGSAEKLRDELHLKAACFADLPAALAHPGVDVVVVCTPSGGHLEIAIAAANAKKHVVVEKPLEITPERCDRIIAACDANRVRLGTIFPSRFSEANIELKKAVETGRLGRVTLGETTCKWWRSQEYYDSGGWRGTWALDGGGALMNQAVHNVDLLLWLMGPATHVSGFTATLAHERIEVEDTAVAVLRFESGALGVIQAATSIHPGYPKTMAIHGDRGSAVVEQDDIIKWDFEPSFPGDDAIRLRFARSSGTSGGASDPTAISHRGHRLQLAEFVEAIRDDRPPAIDGREGRKSVAVICAIYEAARTGTSVTIAIQ